MKALSVRQPWAWAIVHTGKRCENRDWRLDGGNFATARRLVGSTILLHASKGTGTHLDYRSAQFFMREIAHAEGSDWPADVRRIPGASELPLGGIVGRARLARVIATTEQGHRLAIGGPALPCELCGVAMGTSGAWHPCQKADPWAIPGTLGLILADVEPLPFVPLKGMLGFFDVPWVDEVRP